MPVLESVVATLVNDRHSKQYAAAIEEADQGLYRVTFAYGSVGSLQKTGVKAENLTEKDARRIYAKLVAEKTGKRCECCGGTYTPIVEQSTYQTASNPSPAPQSAPADSSAVLPDGGFVPELLEPVSEADAWSYVNDDSYALEEKFDGQRVSIYRDGENVVAFNKLGGLIPVPPNILPIIQALPWNVWLDGEYVKGRYIAFDLLAFGNGDLRPMPYDVRRGQLWIVLWTIGSIDPDHIKHIGVSEETVGIKAKTEALAEFKALKAEGVVFRHLRKPYMPGRQGISRKLKFWDSATVRVRAKDREDGKNSFACEAMKRAACCHDPGDGCDEICDTPQWVNVGQVTCKGPLPAVGTYREVRYLYVGVGGKLYQPEDLGARTDVTDADCSFDQLKHKAVA